jgi:hypothetical protein
MIEEMRTARGSASVMVDTERNRLTEEYNASILSLTGHQYISRKLHHQYKHGNEEGSQRGQ